MQTNRSIPEEVYFAFQNLEISFEDFFTHNAAWISENLKLYAPRVYTEIGAMALAYCDSRINRSRDYDAGMAGEMGAWFDLTTRAHAHNEHTLGLLNWALGKASLAGMTDKENLIKSFCARFSEIKFPDLQYTKVAKVKILDASSRMQKQK